MSAVATAPQTTKFPYAAFPLTQAIHAHPARFRVLCCGRRFGKTMAAVAEGIWMSMRLHHRALQQRSPLRPPRGIFVAPTHDLLAENWRMAKQMVKPWIRQEHIAESYLDLGELGLIEFKSAEREGGVGRGAGYDWAVLDEAARIPEAAWMEDLRPALADRQGRALFISTPWGRNWFYRLWKLGQGTDPTIQSWKYSTLDGWRSRLTDHPNAMAMFDKEWQEILASTSLKTLQQEYLADFLEQEGSLWSTAKLLRGQLHGALPGRTYVAGLDVARVEDFMVTAVVEVETRQLVGLHRSRHRAWDLQKAEAAGLLKQYPHVHVLIDSTGVGDPIAQDMRTAGFSIEDVLFTPRRKSELVENISVAIDHGYIGVPDQPETQWLLEELRDYREWKTASGTIRYGSSDGLHDDGVTALMLATWGLRFDLQRPLERTVSPERPRDIFFPHELQLFTQRSQAWRRAYPNDASPSHPWSVRWDSHQRWKRYAEAIS